MIHDAPAGALAFTAGEERAQLRMLTQFAPDGVVVMDESGHIIEWNPSAESIFGWSREEAIGSTVADLLVVPRFRDSYERWFRRFRSLARDEALTERHRLLGRARDGSEIAVEATIWTTPSSRVGRRLCNAFIRDLTSFEHAEWMQARLAAIVDASEDGIIGTNHTGTIVAWNRGAERLYGYSAGEAIGRDVSMVVPTDRVAELRGLRAKLRRGEAIDPFDTVRLSKAGERLEVSLSLSPHIDAAGRVNGASSIARDISGRKRLEEATRRLNEELEERVEQRTVELARANERLEALVASKTDFVASVSHELRTPLTSVIGFAELLMDGSTGLDSAQRHDILGEIADQGYELANIVEDLLIAARAEIGDLQVSRVSVNLREQAAQVLESMRDHETASIEVAGPGQHAMADPHRVRQVLRNLLTNAIRYGGSRISIRVGEPEDGLAWIAVCDDGVGIPEDARSEIFDPYTRAHERPGVTESFGLGLAISRDLARLMGGDLVYARTDCTEFRLSLPVDDWRQQA